MQQLSMDTTHFKNHFAQLMPCGKRQVISVLKFYILKDTLTFVNGAVSGGVNAACLKSMDRHLQWKCLMAPFLIEHVESITFVMNANVDFWQLKNILQVSSLQPFMGV